MIIKLNCLNFSEILVKMFEYFPGYASIAAGQKENNVSGNGNDEGRSKDEMPTIDDWNADIAKDEEESDSNREYKGRGGGRGGGGRGRRGDSSGYRGRGGKDFKIFGINIC